MTLSEQNVISTCRIFESLVTDFYKLATGLLSNTIDKCDQSQLTEQSGKELIIFILCRSLFFFLLKMSSFIVGVLVNFYSSRLSDQASVPTLMTGLVALTSKFDHFNSSCTNAVLNG